MYTFNSRNNLISDADGAVIAELTDVAAPSDGKRLVDAANSRYQLREALAGTSPAGPAKDDVLQQALQAIRARINGEFDHPALVAIGPLHPSTNTDVLRIIDQALSH